MTARPKDIGTAAETAVVRFLEANGFPLAERRALHGAVDLGDITGTPGIVWEVKGGQAAKGAGDGLITNWMIETETERRAAGADVGILVMQRAAFGPARAGAWWAIVPIWVPDFLHHSIFDHDGEPPVLNVSYINPVRYHLATLTLLLRLAGYGEPWVPMSEAVGT